MKLTYNWLKDFVEIKLPPEKLADKLTMAGIEVKSVEQKGEDFVFEIEITSNRPDWLSVVGVAREVAAITNSKLKTQNVCAKRITHNAKQSLLKISIEDKKDCPYYSAAIIKGVKVSSSPVWLKDRLEAVGLRSINNIVDITNYILLEQGEPLHAFDLDKLASQEIIVRRAKAKEVLATIDAQSRELDQDILVIADNHNAIAAAGVMGGKDSEVTENTQNILLETAIFNPILIRRGRQKLAIQTESSYRFERGVDLETAENARTKAIKMILELCGGQLEILKACPETSKKVKRSITLRLDNAEKLLGVKGLSSALVKKILTPLGFTVKPKSKNLLLVESPGFRQDAKEEIDLVEEVARIYGFEKIPTTLPKITPQLSKGSNKDLVDSLKENLQGLGLAEAITYSLVDRESLNNFGIGDIQLVEVANPLSKEQEVLRPTILPSLLKSVALNLRQQEEYIALFEIAKKFFISPDGQTQERLTLAMVLCGKKNWLQDEGKISHQASILDLKGVIERLFERLGIKGTLFSKNDQLRRVDVCINDKVVGYLQSAAKPLLDKFEIKSQAVFMAELDLEEILTLVKRDKKFVSLPVFPGISRDISIVVKEEIAVGDVIDLVCLEGGLLLEEAGISDIYRGRPIPEGNKNLTISCFYRSGERTLSDSDIQPLHNKLTHALEEKFQASIR